jgi:hypothetical protein
MSTTGWRAGVSPIQSQPRLITLPKALIAITSRSAPTKPLRSTCPVPIAIGRRSEPGAVALRGCPFSKLERRRAPGPVWVVDAAEPPSPN